MEEPENKMVEVSSTSMSPRARLILGLYLLALMIVLLYLLITTWPEKEETTGLSLFGLGLGMEGRILLLVSFAGALGACIHGATSFIYFCGKAQLLKSWGWWYILRPFIGASLAAIVYAALRGSIFTARMTPENMNIFGIAAIAGLSGMFSKQAVEKLRQVFDVLLARLSEAEEGANRSDP